MNQEPHLISFTVIDNDQRFPIKVRRGCYPNLMFLLKEEMGLDSFGECGGVGRCATCVVRAIGIKGISANKERNEPNTLEQLGYDEKNIRLSCQLFITSDLEGTEITILDI
ncbi:2Fe-2S iron-sulfur cluster-binding protein [Flavobacterium sp. 7A]|uniref:2Fe-2S iron-sulfur cluster-binding protein n=1 Tax=Flavobacterium sp. 7A TaxID=2940571 RepID=UPI002225E417|nr:2Fe-2S iron-sulfur cluster-binding protein [Flavobacterium sp. 7A]MCW2119303.1 2Fe-2S ferredoxin [Flavobacterium sp. 7A]